MSVRRDCPVQVGEEALSQSVFSSMGEQKGRLTIDAMFHR